MLVMGQTYVPGHAGTHGTARESDGAAAEGLPPCCHSSPPALLHLPSLLLPACSLSYLSACACSLLPCFPQMSNRMFNRPTDIAVHPVTGAGLAVGESSAILLHPLIVSVETPVEGRGGCGRITELSPTAQELFISDGWGSRRRDFCHLADTPSRSLLKHLLKGEGGAAESQNYRRRLGTGMPRSTAWWGKPPLYITLRHSLSLSATLRHSPFSTCALVYMHSWLVYTSATLHHSPSTLHHSPSLSITSASQRQPGAGHKLSRKIVETFQ